MQPARFFARSTEQSSARAWRNPFLGYVRKTLTDPFVARADEVLTLSSSQLDLQRRSGLLRLILFSVAFVLVFLVIPAAFLTNAIPIFLFTLIAEFVLASICLVVNQVGSTNLAGGLFISGTLIVGIRFTLQNPNGLDFQGILLYAILSLVCLITGLVLPVWVIGVSALALMSATTFGVLSTPLSAQFHLTGTNTLSMRVNILTLLLANQGLAAAFSWMYSRSAASGIQGAIRAVEREQELIALQDQFLVDANHELRTPIMAWYNDMELLARLGDRATPPQRTRIFARAQSSGEAVRRLLATMLDPVLLETGTPKLTVTTVMVAPLVRSVLETFQSNTLSSEFSKRASETERIISMEVADSLCVMADADRLRQVIVNLLTNALKYSDPGTPLTIVATDVAQYGPIDALLAIPSKMRRREQGSQPPAHVQIGVRDRGFGVPLGDAPKIFSRFVRLERDIAGPVRGTGVGLYLCRTLIEAMGGRIWVESDGVPGEGSTFWLTLPVGAVQSEVHTEVAVASQIVH